MAKNHNAEWESLDAAPSNPASGNHKLYFKDGDLHAVNSAGTERNLQKAHNWEYADAAAREAATGFTSADLKKLALQLDDMTLWVLTATTPTWVQVGASSNPILYRFAGSNLMNTLTTDEMSALYKAESVGALTLPNLQVGQHFHGHFNGALQSKIESPGTLTFRQYVGEEQYGLDYVYTLTNKDRAIVTFEIDIVTFEALTPPPEAWVCMTTRITIYSVDGDSPDIILLENEWYPFTPGDDVDIDVTAQFSVSNLKNYLTTDSGYLARVS